MATRIFLLNKKGYFELSKEEYLNKKNSFEEGDMIVKSTNVLIVKPHTKLSLIKE